MAARIFKRMKLPCMGLYLQGAVKALAVVEIGVVILTIAIATLDFAPKFEEVAEQLKSGSAEALLHIISFTSSYLYKGISVILAIWLILIASGRKLNALKWWMAISWVGFILWILVAVVNYALGFWSYLFSNMVSFAIFVAHVLYKFYSFWTIWCFMQEIKRNGATDHALCVLSDAELDEFMNGDALHTHPFLQKPYQKDFEIPLSQLIIDTTSTLGRGEFGVVYRAQLLNIGGGGEEDGLNYGITVAVKTIPPERNVLHFKALLRELQILNYIGNHENIVGLIGACTTEVKQRNLYLIVEFWDYGSLHSYIYKNRDQLTHDSGEDCGVETGSLLCIRDLIKWSMQTANAMEYIVNQNVIHGDLAARHVLLTAYGNAKISDFGLSKKLYHYSTYAKHNNGPLPWRWMAPETLTNLKFSANSDVWSFGITVWEFFSGAMLPYGGVQYSNNFLTQLKTQGVSLGRPLFANKKIFEEIQKCCAFNADDRPSFSTLKSFFRDVLSDYSQQTYALLLVYCTD